MISVSHYTQDKVNLYFWRTEGRIVSFAAGRAGSCTLAFCRLQFASSDDSESACIALKSRRLSFQKAPRPSPTRMELPGLAHCVCPHVIHQEQTVFQGVRCLYGLFSGSLVVEVSAELHLASVPKLTLPCL